MAIFIFFVAMAGWMQKLPEFFMLIAAAPIAIPAVMMLVLKLGGTFNVPLFYVCGIVLPYQTWGLFHIYVAHCSSEFSIQ